MFPGAADAEDAAQDAMIAVVRGLPRFDGRSSLSTWVHRVTTNSCLDELRRRRRRPVVVRRLDAAPDDDRRAPGTDRADPAAEGDDRVVDRLSIDDALAALPEDFRVAVVLRDQLGLDYAEIAEVLGIAPGTVRSRIARGRRRLAELLGADHHQAEGGSADDGGAPGNHPADRDVQGTAP